MEKREADKRPDNQKNRRTDGDTDELMYRAADLTSKVHFVWQPSKHCNHFPLLDTPYPYLPHPPTSPSSPHPLQKSTTPSLSTLTIQTTSMIFIQKNPIVQRKVVLIFLWKVNKSRRHGVADDPWCICDRHMWHTTLWELEEGIL